VSTDAYVNGESMSRDETMAPRLLACLHAHATLAPAVLLAEIFDSVREFCQQGGSERRHHDHHHALPPLIRSHRIAPDCAARTGKLSLRVRVRRSADIGRCTTRGRPGQTVWPASSLPA
jgi:hypothetical protein